MLTPFNLSKPIAIGADHAGFDYKEDIISFIDELKVTDKVKNKLKEITPFNYTGI